MLKTKKRLFVTIIIILAVALATYLFYSGAIPIYRSEQPARTGDDIIFSREVSVVSTFEVPGGEDVVEFALFLDDEGSVADVRSVGVFDSSINVHLEEFSQGLLLVIKGKKLADLEEIDRVGTSTLTTDAFNDSLEELKSQI